MLMMKEKKAHLVMVLVQLIYAGMAMFSKAAISQGMMNPFVFVAYRQAFATLSLLPFVFYHHCSKKLPDHDPLSKTMLLKIFFVSFIGITVSLNLYTYAIKYVSATFASASINNIPALTFLIAVIFRIEKLSIREYPQMLKLVGTCVSVSGAMVFAFAKGPPIPFPFPLKSRGLSSSGDHHEDDLSSRQYKWIQGCLLMISANTTWASFLVMQAYLVKQYPAKTKLTMLMCMCSCIQSTAWGVAMERNMSSWILKWDINLLSTAYCGVVVTGLSYWLQLWTVERKGPLFTASFTPLALIVTALLSALIWNEILHLGSVFGGMLVVGGLYFVLWGNSKEEAKKVEANTNNNNNVETQHMHVCNRDAINNV